MDLIVDCGDTLIPVEIKSGQTVVADFFRGLDYWRRLAGDTQQAAALVYGGDESQKRRDSVVYSWRQWA